ATGRTAPDTRGMSRKAVLRLYDGLNVWSGGAERAPHKPLLVLYALARWSRGVQPDVPFADVDRDLTPLLREFGPPRRRLHPEYPFWYLRNDGVWVVQATGPWRCAPERTSPQKARCSGPKRSAHSPRTCRTPFVRTHRSSRSCRPPAGGPFPGVAPR